MDGQLHADATLTPRKEPPIPIGYKAGELKVLDPRAVQPIASRYKVTTTTVMAQITTETGRD
jgi:hypothetical protein